jgi:cytochrome c oxidase subunit II
MMNLLILAVIVLTVLAVARIVRVTELSSEISGEDDTQITRGDNFWNGVLMIVFLVVGLVLMVVMTVSYNKFTLPVSASEHGVEVDTLLNVNFLIIGIVFFLTQILLFVFAFKYRHNHQNRAYFYPDNHKLEIIWTIIPTIVLGGIIFYGLTVWNRITVPAPAEAMEIEVFGKQFSWLARYPGPDGKLGPTDFNMISADNELGVVTADGVVQQIASLKVSLSEMEQQYALLKNDQLEERKAISTTITQTKSQITRLFDLKLKTEDPNFFKHSHDDIIARELHMPVNKPVLLQFRSHDVIHSAYLPHFRVQMNTVPGMRTHFHFVPTITTNQMKEITKNENFEYILLCNKICGVAHFNMKMHVGVSDETEFKKWLSIQSLVFPAAETIETPVMTPAEGQAQNGVKSGLPIALQ